VDVAPGDILDPASLARAMPPGVDAVFHVAGDTSLWRRLDGRQTRINVEGTRHVVEAALAAGAGRFIQTSTLSAYGRHSGVVTEQTPSNAAQSPINYERSKWLAEQEVRAGIARGLDAVILNPAAIVGPRDTTNWARMFYLLRDGKIPFVTCGEASFNHVDEIVAAHIAAYHHGRSGENYLLGGPSATMAELTGLICAALGRRPPRLRMPQGVLLAMGGLLASLQRSTAHEPLMTPEMARMMSARLVCSSDKSIQKLAYKQRKLDACVTDAHAWLTAEGLL
jgi:nucleoside-diphosphate-sugar epimerase